MVMYRATKNGKVQLTADEEAAVLAERAVVEVPNEVTMVQAEKALYAAGLLSAVTTNIATLGELNRIEWRRATHVRYDNALVDTVVRNLGWTKKQKDDLFIAASKL